MTKSLRTCMAPRPWMQTGVIEHTEPRSLRVAGRRLRPQAPGKCLERAAGALGGEALSL